MSDDMAAVLLMSLCWWAAVTAAYAALLFGLDALLTAWRHRQRVRRERRAELDRIHRDADAAVQRIGVAFAVAQRLIREECAGDGRGGR